MIEGFLSKSAKSRLPAAIQKLGEAQQTVFIMLRLRKSPEHISRALNTPPAQTAVMISQVQEALVKSGALDLIQDPVFYPIDQSREDDQGNQTPGLQLFQDEPDMSTQLDFKRFHDALVKSIEALAKEERRFLSLWFNREMRAKDILSFYRNLGVPFNPAKPLEDCTEQDIFYFIEKCLRNLTAIVRKNIKGSEVTPLSLKAILEETGV